ncbi:hypothetical protein [Mariniblastus fucicola]|uniref:PilZ domain protein n=1 Tax=Mariniblastus fucicola TaxID=980251 RepID=A0A5B9P788_9BACT|nr:hypothetical protein [Mariniblastus fucicola]QEG22168.1 hypothetical protein MFFC18_20290 [Mariniblastus fucicola]
MNERRKFHRIRSQHEPCIVVVDDVKFDGVLADESISGFKISDLALLMLPFNKPLSLNHRGETVPVRARNVDRDSDNTFVLGVVRSEILTPEQSCESQAMLINCYVQHGDATVICVPIRIESETQVLIQLWDGVQFRVHRSQLKPMTRIQRFEMLSSDQRCLAYTAAMYGFEEISAANSSRQVFEHEFGTYENCPVARALVAAR